MKKPDFSSQAMLLAGLLAFLPLAATAQRTRQDSLLRAGDLVGGRSHASQPRAARLGSVTSPTAAPSTAAARRPASAADPALARLLQENVDVDHLPAAELPGLYDRLLDVAQRQGRQWSARDWNDASAALAHLNARYEAVRLELPLNQRMNVRSAQGEFHTLKAARQL